MCLFLDCPSHIILRNPINLGDTFWQTWPLSFPSPPMCSTEIYSIYSRKGISFGTRSSMADFSCEVFLTEVIPQFLWEIKYYRGNMLDCQLPVFSPGICLDLLRGQYLAPSLQEMTVQIPKFQISQFMLYSNTYCYAFVEVIFISLTNLSKIMISSPKLPAKVIHR